MGSHTIVQRQHFIDNGLKAALSDEFENGAQLVFRAHVRTHDRELPGKQKTQVDFDVKAGGSAAGDETAAVCEAFDAVIPSCCADMFENDIDATVARKAPDFVGNGHDAMVNDFVGADELGFLELYVITCGGDDMGAEEFCNLDSGAADPTSRSDHKNALGGLKLSAMDEHVPRGLENKGNSRGVGPIEIFRVRHAVQFGAANVFGATAVNHVAEVGEVAAKVVVAREAGGTLTAGDARREDHLLADVHGGDLGTDFGDFAGNITARYVRKRYGNAGKAAPYPEIEVVQGAGVDTDEDFTRAEMRLGNVGIAKNAGITVLLDDDGFHGRPPGRGQGLIANPADIS